MPKSEKMKTVSPERLKYAREYYGISVHEASQRSKIKEEDIERFENGTDYPSYAKLDALSSLYNRPLLFFFFQTQPPKEDLTVKFRSIEKRMSVSLDMQTRTMMEKAECYKLNLQELYANSYAPCFCDMLTEHGITSSDKLIEWIREILDFSIDKQKSTFRRAEDVLEYLREHFFNIGIYIFKDSFRIDSVSGLCLYDELFPIILLNNKTSFTRQIFTVFHELFHIYAKESDVFYPNDFIEEMECDKFASELLIPDADFERRIRSVKVYEDKALIEDIAKEYSVSPVAIAYRLLKKKKISKEFYLTVQDDSIRRMNAASSGGNFYYTRISYLGRPYLNRVFSDYYSGKISISNVSKYTGLKATHISRLSSYMTGGVL